jgi:hypothetical protein
MAQMVRLNCGKCNALFQASDYATAQKVLAKHVASEHSAVILKDKLLLQKVSSFLIRSLKEPTFSILEATQIHDEIADILGEPHLVFAKEKEEEKKENGTNQSNDPNPCVPVGGSKAPAPENSDSQVGGNVPGPLSGSTANAK